MAIKYIDIPEKKQTVAILSGIEFDTYTHINKIVGNGLDDRVVHLHEKYLMPNTLRVTVTAVDPDVYDKAEGRKAARKKLMKHYYNMLHKRLEWFAKDMKEASNKIKRRLDSYDET